MTALGLRLWALGFVWLLAPCGFGESRDMPQSLEPMA
jgi:hypothetical protein